MFQVYSLKNEYKKSNINGDYYHDTNIYSFTNEGKKDVEIHSINLFIKSPKRIQMSSYGNKVRLINGYNFMIKRNKTKETLYVNGNKKPVKQFDDLIKYGFDLIEDKILDNSTIDGRYKMYRFTKKLPRPILLHKGDTFQVAIKDDMTNFIDQKVILDLFYN